MIPNTFKQKIWDRLYYNKQPIVAFDNSSGIYDKWIILQINHHYNIIYKVKPPFIKDYIFECKYHLSIAAYEAGKSPETDAALKIDNFYLLAEKELFDKLIELNIDQSIFDTPWGAGYSTNISH